MMARRGRRRFESVGRAVFLAVLFCWFHAGASMVAASTDTLPPDESTTTIETTVPDDGDGAEPDAGETTDSGDDDDAADALTWLAVGASVALVGVAAWWLVRRVEDGHTDVSPMDDDWPGGSEVI